MNMNDFETISMDEVTALLKAAAARDQRTVDAIDTLAWYQDLNTARVHYRDASAALSDYYVNVWPRQDAKQRFRATAPVLIEIVREIRKKRLAESDFCYEPQHHDESGWEYSRRLRAQIAAVADGRQPEQPAGRVLKPRPVAELVASVAAARALPPEIVEILKPRRNPARTVTCPYCKAVKGSPCRNGAGRDLPGGALHPSRTEVWTIAVAPCPLCRAPAGEVCQELGKPYPHGCHPSRIESATETQESAS